MNYLATHENKTRGTFDFPIEFHYVDPNHPRYHMPFHWHMEYEMILVLSGSFTLCLGTATRTLNAGDAAFIPDGVIHGGTPHDCVYECVVFDFARFLQENPIGRKSLQEALNTAAQQPHFYEKGSPACCLIDALFETMEKEPPGYEFNTAGLLWQLMGLLVRQTAQAYPPPPPRNKRTEQMKQVLRRIRRDYAEPLTLDDLAAEAGMTPKYFCRAFRQITGRTPVDYLNYYRVECAGELLCATDSSITEIALSCGYNDLSYFARSFRRYKGVSAQKYRHLQG
ncbi:MAG: AraC family transcriptional regulator [Gemmiger sp.]|nr:AraC family transcriptional regulator [Gemmiger sp.]